LLKDFRKVYNNGKVAVNSISIGIKAGEVKIKYK
jgi:hypothetical protein